MKPIARVVLGLLIAALVAIAFGMLFHSPAHAQPTGTLCADPVTNPNITGAVVTIDGAAVPGSTCSFEPVGNARRAVCRFPRPLADGVHLYGMSYTGGPGTTPSPVTTKPAASRWVCGKTQASDSSVTCTIKFGPEPAEQMPATFCGGLSLAPTVYVVTGAAAYPINADGSRSIYPVSTKPALGSVCNCATKQILGAAGARYCAVTVPGVSQLVVAGCSPQK